MSIVVRNVSKSFGDFRPSTTSRSPSRAAR